MLWLYDNVAVLTVALATSLVAWLFGGTRGDLLAQVAPWLFVITMEVLLFFPQRHRGESSMEARVRVWAALKHDRLVWISGGCLVLLAIPFVNYGLCPHCDAEMIAAGFDPKPPIPIVPFCVNRVQHLNVVYWFMLALSTAVLVRHGLVRRGKRMALEFIVWNGMALAILGFVQEVMGAPGPFWDTDNGTFYGNTIDFFSSFGYSNMAGSYFTTLFGIAVALWRDHYERFREEAKTRDTSKSAPPVPRTFWKKHYFLIPAGVFLFAAMNTFSRAAIFMVSTLAVICFVHTLVSFVSRMHRVRRVKVVTWSALIFSLVVYFAVVAAPSSVKKEMDRTGTIEVLDRVTGKMRSVRAAVDIWKDNRLFGCGGWGYRHFLLPKLTQKEIDMRLHVVGGINVHNDHLQFMLEHGLVGFGLLVAIVVLLVRPIAVDWRELVRGLRFKSGADLPPRPVAIFALPASVLFILLTVFFTVIHACGDCPMRSSAVLVLFFVSLAAMPGFMPRKG